MPQTTFIDAIGQVALNKAVCQIDLLSHDKLSNLEKDGLTVAGRLAMSAETLLSLHAALNHVVAELESKGLVKRKDS